MQIRRIASVAAAIVAIGGIWAFGRFVVFPDYHFAVAHAEELIAEGQQMMELAADAAEPLKIDDVRDARVPGTIRQLRPSAIVVTANEVYVYTGGHAGKGLFIYRHPQETPPIRSDCTRIEPRLWWYAGA